MWIKGYLLDAVRNHHKLSWTFVMIHNEVANLRHSAAWMLS